MKINRYEQLNEAPSSSGVRYKHPKISIDDILNNSENRNALKDNLINWLKTKKIATSHGDNSNLVDNLNKYDPTFIEYFVKCMGKNALSDENNLFLNFLNNPSARKVLTNKNNFTDIYNLLLNTDKINLDYVKDKSALIYYPDLYNNTDKNNTRLGLIDLDMKAAKNGGVEIEGLITEEDDPRNGTVINGPWVSNNETPKKTISRQQIKNAISRKEVVKLINIAQKSGTEIHTEIKDTIKSFDKLNDTDKKLFLQQNFSVTPEKANELVTIYKDNKNKDANNSKS